MKYIIAKFKKFNSTSLLDLIESTLDHRLFKPITISVVTSFILINGFDYAQKISTDFKELSAIKHQTTPIKINVSKAGLAFDIDEEQIVDHRVKSGETALKILLDLGADEADAFNILSEMKKVYDPKSIGVKDVISIKYKVKVGYDSESQNASNVDRKMVITGVSFSPSSERKIDISRKANGEYEAKENKLVLTKNISRYYGTLKSGLFADGVKAGISPTSMMNMINLYSYDVDFQRDIHNGDRFEMLVESFYTEDGRKVRDGNVLFSSLILQDRPIEIYTHVIDGRPEYFDAKGNSVKKSLLRTPINGARISSSFGLRRHPILGYSKMHKGTDFAAPSGTPILAAGSGTISYYSVKGGYGNFVQIKHNQDYSTAYGHASKFVKKLKVGSKVKQGDVVAYVGTTGRSTGPHLHFEVIFKGQAVNPSKVKATSGLKLTGKELARFQAAKDSIDKYRKNIPNQIKAAQ